MKVLVTLSARFNKGQDGRIYPQNPALTYDLLFTRYLNVFDGVLVAARIEPLAGEPLVPACSDGPGVSFLNIPSFSGVIQLARSILPIRKILRQAIQETQAYFLRVPSVMGDLVWRELRRLRLPYAVEVVGDPADSLQKGAVNHPLRPFLRWLAVRQLQAEVSGAAAAAYVTEHMLQQRYPPGPATHISHYSSIELPKSHVRAEPKYYTQPATRLIYVGTLEVLYKAPDILIQALALTKGKGVRFHLTIVGDGRRRPQLETQVASLGLTPQVSFAGRVAAAQVFDLLDEADIFILPSKTEGMPKAMIEAMARALPCIGSTAGGIPELLQQEYLVSPGDAQALADKIMEVAGDPERLTKMSARNLTIARNYSAEILREKRRDFYLKVREISAKCHR